MTRTSEDYDTWDYEPKHLVWHYTTGPALISILKNHELWASSTAFMNDTGEWLLADKYLREAKRQYPKAYPRVLESYLKYVGGWSESGDDPDESRYLLSGSQSGDSLTMWRGYAGTDEVSYAIGLDRREGLAVLSPPEMHKRPVSKDASVSSWFDVIYDPVAAKNQAEKVVAEIYEDYDALTRIKDQGKKSNGIGDIFNKISDLTESLRSKTKHEGFRHEEESRIVVNAQQGLARYRAGRWGTVPYLALTGAGDHSQTVVSKPSKLPLREIYISPGSGRYAAGKSLELLLHSHGYGASYDEVLNAPYNQIKVRVSATPFR